MANVLFCYPNVADGGSFYLTHGGSWLAALPLTNMQDARIAKRARSVDATTASTRFAIDLGSDTYFRAFGLIGHNLSQAATIRLELGNDSTFAATNYDSTALRADPHQRRGQCRRIRRVRAAVALLGLAAGYQHADGPRDRMGDL